MIEYESGQTIDLSDFLVITDATLDQNAATWTNQIRTESRARDHSTQ